MKEDFEQETEIVEGTKTIIAKRTEMKHQIRDSVEGKVQEFLTSISIPPFDPQNKKPGRFVKPDENVQQVTDEVINTAIGSISTDTDNISTGVTLVKHVSVAREKLPLLQDADGNFKTDIPATDEIDHILSRPANHESSQMLTRIEPVNMCRPQDFPYDKCTTNPENGNDDNDDGEPVTDARLLIQEDLPKHTNKLIQDISPPDKPVSVLFDGNGSGRIDAQPNGQAGDNDDVQDTIDEFKLDRGPADVAAIYDFHHLQIAFEHVWERAVR